MKSRLYSLILLLSTVPVARAGVQYSVIASTSPATAASVRGNWFYSTGYFYGTATNNVGTIYRYDLINGQFELLHTFGGGANGSQPAGLVETSNGFLFGVAYEGNNNLGTIFRITRTGSSFSNVHHFTNLSGGDPMGTPFEASDHKLYGVVGKGGAWARGGVYRINLDGTGYSLQRAFSGTSGTAPGDGDGSGELIEGPDGLIYGTTKEGGSNDTGVVFSLEKDGDPYTVLHEFAATGLRNPSNRLLLASDDFLYGVAEQGGADDLGGVFRIARDGSGYRVVREFRASDGYNTSAPLVEGADGYLYGAAFYSESNNGTIFRLPKSGRGLATLHRFQNAPDGGQPDTNLIELTPRTFFGTTSVGGTNTSGTLFRLTATLEPPKVTIKGPKTPIIRGGRLILRGRAADELGLQRVEYSTGKAFKPATGTTKWSARIPVKPGSGKITVRVRAVDNDALTSATATVRARR